MDTLSTILETQKTLEANFNKRFLELDSKLKTASPHTHPTIASLSKEVSSFKEQMSAMLELLRQQILGIHRTVDAMETRHRRKNLVVSGVPEVADEDVAVTIATICQRDLHLPEVTCASISMCHRLGSATQGRPRAILVRFSNLQARNAVWTKKTALKGSSVVISEFLTKHRQTVFIEARKHFGMRRVWTRDGTIYVKLASGKKERLFTAEELHALIEKHPSNSRRAAPATEVPSPLAPASAAPASMPAVAVEPESAKSLIDKRARRC
ncbi:uncharacterized protein LOC133521845 [Cydia pomonella]|uniref:uncharacterized protein LOC133521845 n=1 Tax=Cydia pomonella TaxID=82600 RepID=UPI002ADDD6AD|nr:uncharacterized protein LOC133521845 [Cydia pomonella]